MPYALKYQTRPQSSYKRNQQGYQKKRKNNREVVFTFYIEFGTLNSKEQKMG